jgi:AraC-like DNA-binding protein
MLIGNEYVFFKDVQDTIISTHSRTGEGIGFLDAVQQLLVKKSFMTGIASKPDFFHWDLTDMNQLYHLANQIPIYLSEVFHVMPQIQDNYTYLPAIRPIQICLESYFSPNHLTLYDYFTIIYVVQGTCTISFSNTKYSLTVGELCIISPHTPHRVYVEPGNLVVDIMSDPQHFENYFFHLISKENVLSDFFRNSLYRTKQEYLLFHMPLTRDVKGIIQHLFQEFVSGEQFSTEVFHNYLQIFYATIIRSHDTTYTYYEAEKKSSPSTVIPAILNYINNNYRTLSLEALANHFHYNCAYLSNLIKTSTGKTYSDIVTSLKIKEAKSLLCNTSLSVEKISELVGYHSADHFTHSFKLMNGLSPRAYRKTNKSDVR